MSDYVHMVAPATLEIFRDLPASPERVWQYLADPELRKKWFCAGPTGSQAGEDFVMDFDHSRLSTSAPPEDAGCGDPIVMRGTIRTFNPPHELSYDWPDEHGGATLVTIRLTAEGDGTRLHLQHSRLDNPEFRTAASAGWHAHLDLLCDLMNGQTTRDFWDHYGSLKAEYDRRNTDAAAS